LGVTALAVCELQLRSAEDPVIILAARDANAREPDLEMRYHSDVVGVAVQRLTSSKL
jgi:hypothetical protein